MKALFDRDSYLLPAERLKERLRLPPFEMGAAYDTITMHLVNLFEVKELFVPCPNEEHERTGQWEEVEDDNLVSLMVSLPRNYLATQKQPWANIVKKWPALFPGCKAEQIRERFKAMERKVGALKRKRASHSTGKRSRSDMR